MSDSYRILVVEDEPGMLATVKLCLSGAGYRVLEAADGARGVQMAIEEKPDLILLDVNLPKVNGFDACAELRRQNFDRPILMLTTRTEIPDRVKGLSAGADDYLAKPFDGRELVARIHALLRRFQRDQPVPRTLQLGDITIDLAQQTATRAGEPLRLTQTEYGLLALLAETPGKPVSREQMLAGIWGYTYLPNTRTVDTHIWRLRKKLGDDGEDPRWIKNAAGKGYLLAL